MSYDGNLATDLQELEDKVLVALAKRDMGDLEVIGFGEFSVAFGFGNQIAKRAPTFTPDQFTAYKAMIGEYIGHFDAAGIPTTPTQVESVPGRDQRVTGYLVQPRHQRETVGGTLLRNATPDADHPLIVQIGEHVSGLQSDTIGIDAQVTNWALVDGRAEVFDFGTPIWVRPDGKAQMDMAPFLRGTPAPIRWLAAKAMLDLMKRFLDPAAVLVDAVSGLLREGLDDWVNPAIATWSRQVGTTISEDQARANLKEDLRILPPLKKAQQLQRKYVELRGGTYDFFIHTTYGDDRLL